MLSSISKSLRGVAIGVAAALVLSVQAGAVPIAVTYAMNFSIFSPAANAVVLSGPGTLTVAFSNGTSLGHVGPGPLHVLGGTAMLNNTFSILGGFVMFTGMQNIVFPGSGMGTATGLGMFNLATVGHIAAGFLHCTGGGCGLAMFPSSVNVPLTSGPRTINLTAGILAGFPSVGPQNFTGVGTGGMTPNGGVFAVTATGTEISRGFVPEPGTGALLGLGLAGLGITTAIRRRGRF